MIKTLKKERYSFIEDLKSDLRSKKAKLGKYKKVEYELEESIVNTGSDKAVTTRLRSIINQIHQLEQEVKNEESHIADLESQIEIQLPSYYQFLNFFKNIVTVIGNTDDSVLMDQLVKYVFVNLTVGDKNVVGYELSEPFKTLNSMKFLSGVNDGT